MFRNNKLLILCFIFVVHASDRDYDAELAADSDNGEDFWRDIRHLRAD